MILVRNCLVFLAMMLAGALAPVGAQELDVAVSIEGVEDRPELRRDLRALTRIDKADRPYTSLALLRRTASGDARRMHEALVSKGYYAATVSAEPTRIGIEALVTFLIETGPRFTITSYTITYDDQPGTERPQSFADIGEETTGDPSGDRLRALETAILSHLWNTGFPEAQPEGRFVQADFSTGTATAVFPITTGPRAVYGEVVVSGAKRTEPPFIDGLFRPEQGTEYQRRDIDAFRTRLIETNLFNAVTVEPGATGPDGRTDILVDVEERKRRTVGGGIGFSTDVGVGVSAFWENRNLFGRGETLSVRAAYQVPRQELGVVFEKPLPWLPGAWNATALAENEDTDAFEAQSLTVGSGLSKRLLAGDLTLEGSVQYQISNITDSDGTEDTFQAVRFPLSARFNNEDNQLNPTSGYRAQLQVTPFFGDLQFNRVVLSGATRYGFFEDNRFLVASRGRLGATLGASGDELPATERFFAGGGGSVRGYAFQEAGPIDPTDGDPTGGASTAELNLEARLKITSSIQLAVFADGGTVFESETPDFSGDFLIGAGIGVRYLTPIGPVRIDIATPLDRREIRRRDEMGNLVLVDADDDPATPPTPETVFEDDPIQLIIALGQPF